MAIRKLPRSMARPPMLLVLLILPMLDILLSAGCGENTPTRECPVDPEGVALQRIESARLQGMRDEVVSHLWGVPTLPTDLGPPLVVHDLPDTNYTDLHNLRRIDELKFKMDFGLSSVVYHFLPAMQLRRLVLYHQGHSGDFVQGKATIASLVAEGYAVMAIAMPLIGRNALTDRVELPSGRLVTLDSHARFIALEDEGIATLRFFLEPLIMALDYAEQSWDYHSFDMIGLSGGGWTTTLYSGIDPRIRNSFPVAGTLPFHLRTDPGSVGDYEQSELRPLYAHARYLDFYVLGAFEPWRRQLQVLNAYDPCCFAADERVDLIDQYNAVVQQTLHEVEGGKFDVYIDDSHEIHQISGAAMALILEILDDTP